MAPHLVAAVSAHGFGHFAQVAPVLNALYRRIPTLRVTLYSALPYAIMAQRLEFPFEQVVSTQDFGLHMHDAFDVDVAASWRAYSAFLDDWDARVDAEARVLAGLKPDLVVANVPFLTLAGAARAGIPSVGLGSLNWLDIGKGYFHAKPGAAALFERIANAYNSVRFFIRLTPGMPMDAFTDVRVVGPVASSGRRRGAELRAFFQVDEDTKIALVTPGGIETEIDARAWPSHPGIRWIVPPQWGVSRNDVAPRDSWDWPFVDLMASCDVVVTKPGYGSLVEALCNGVPLIMALRGDWPEERFLLEWPLARQHVRVIEKHKFISGNMIDEVLASRPLVEPLEPTGIAQAAALILPLLS